MRHNKLDQYDEDLYEELDDEMMGELISQNKRYRDQQSEQPKRPLRKWAFWFIVFVLVLQGVALIPKTFSIPAIQFFHTSAQLSLKKDVRLTKQAVVTIETNHHKGTGFVIDADGLIVTNAHVVDNAKYVNVSFRDKKFKKGKVVKTFSDVDLSIIRVNTTESLPHLTLSHQHDYQNQKPVYFVGNPLQFNRIANQGKLIGKVRLKNWDKPVFMLDAPVYHGNSGSPVMDHHNHVIGVIFATINHDTEGKVGLMIPINYLQMNMDEN